MKTTTLAGVCILAAGFANTVQADHHMEAAQAAPVEMLTCNYNDNSDRDDLDRVISKFNKWADKNDKSYTAWTITPNFVNADITMDVGWLGAWPDGNAMGVGLEAWDEKGLQAEFDKVMTCDTHIGASSINIKPPTSTPPGDGVISFASCTLDEDSSPEKLMGAHRAMAEFMGGKGSSAGVWLFFPNWGAGDMDFDYYRVIGHDSYTEAGKSTEIYNNGGGWQKAMEVFDGVSSCDGPRVYSADLVRTASGG
jgi:hypothetical protein